MAYDGEFNEIAYSHEKQGDRLRDERGMKAFRSTLDIMSFRIRVMWVNGLHGIMADFLRIIFRKD